MGVPLDHAPRVLVVEDDLDTGRLLSGLLRREGYEVEWVVRGSDACEHVTRGFDLVLLDLMLPDGDGGRVAEWIAEAAPPRPRVIVLSSRRPDHLAPAARRQILASFRKPFDVGGLLATMARAVEGSSGSALASAIAHLRAAPPRLGVEDVEGWDRAQRVVELALSVHGTTALRARHYDLDLALRAYTTTCESEQLLATAHVPGGGTLDCLVGDARGYALLQLALAIARHFGEPA